MKNYRELWLVVDQRKAWEKGYEGAVGVGQTGVHPDQIRFFKPVPWTTLVKGEWQQGPAVVEPGEPGVLTST